jgi:hypothetical protein
MSLPLVCRFCGVKNALSAFLLVPSCPGLLNVALRKATPRTMKNLPTHRKVNWIPLPNPITEAEVNIQLDWTADERTRQAIERQAACMGFKSPTEYLHQLIAATLAGNEEDTVIAKDGRIARGHDAYDKDGVPQDV